MIIDVDCNVYKSAIIYTSHKKNLNLKTEILCFPACFWDWLIQI